jgi:O-methyltransferase
MAGRERHVALLRAVEYLERRSVPGAFAECGVWRGGSVLVMILKLLDLGVTERDIFLYDTFEGMTEPTAHDTSAFATPALEEWEAARESGRRAWTDLFGEDRFGFEQVQDLLVRTGYPKERLHFVAGRVEDTIPAAAPDSLALLRLDTDWYESTRHELEHLYPRLSPAGVLIIDDYGHWEGCRRAVDEYFASGDVPPLLLNRVDYTCVLAVKV